MNLAWKLHLIRPFRCPHRSVHQLAIWNDCFREVWNIEHLNCSENNSEWDSADSVLVFLAMGKHSWKSPRCAHTTTTFPPNICFWAHHNAKETVLYTGRIESMTHMIFCRSHGIRNCECTVLYLYKPLQSLAVPLVVLRSHLCLSISKVTRR